MSKGFVVRRRLGMLGIIETFSSMSGLLVLSAALWLSGCPADSEDSGEERNSADNAFFVSPAEIIVARGGQRQFSAQMDGNASPQVLWNILESERSVETGISSGGLLVIGKDEKLKTLTVTACYVENPETYGTATVTVYDEATVSGVEVTPLNVSVAKGGTTSFSANVDGTFSPSQQVTWMIKEREIAQRTSINANGVLTVDIEESLQYLTIIAVSTLDTAKSGTAVVTVDSSTVEISEVSILPAPAQAVRGGTVFFHAAVEGTNYPSQAVNWYIEETGKNAQTTIDEEGRLFVAVNEELTSLTVIASSIIDPSKSASSTVTIHNYLYNGTVTKVSVTPKTITVEKGGTVKFSAGLAGENDPDKSVAWSVLTAGRDPGTGITSDGLLIVNADESLVRLTVRAASASNPAVYDDAVVTVAAPAGSGTVNSVEITPSTASVNQGGYLTFTANVTGSDGVSNDVTWSVMENLNPGTGITGDGVLVVNIEEETPYLTIQAVSSVDPSKYDQVRVGVLPASRPDGTVTKITLSPLSATVEQGAYLDFTARVTGEGEPLESVYWSIKEKAQASQGTFITSGGRLVVDSKEPLISLTVIATSVMDSTKYASALVTIAPGSGAGLVTDVTVTPETVSLTCGEAAFFSSVVSGQASSVDQTVLWSIDEAFSAHSGTGITSTGKLVVSKNETLSYITVRATSTVNSSRYATATVTLNPYIAPQVSKVTIAPAQTTLTRGSTGFFSASVEGTGDFSQTVLWSIENTDRKSATMIASDGWIYVPLDETLSSLTIKAVSLVDRTKSDTVTVSLTGPGPSVTKVIVSPSTLTMYSGTSSYFNAVVQGTGSPSQSVIWSIVESDKRSATEIYSTGLFNVDLKETATKLTVKAESVEDTSKYGLAEVTIISNDAGDGNCYVYFDSNGGTAAFPERNIVTFNEPYGYLPNVSRENCVFIGWWTEAEGGKQVTADTYVTTDLMHTLYAHWITGNGTFALSFDSNGGEAPSFAIKPVTYGKSYGELPAVSREDYNFIGWFTEEEGGIKIKNTSPVSIPADHTLYAQWLPHGINGYTVTFDSNGGEDPSELSKIVVFNMVYGELPVVIRAGYNFVGWFTESGLQVLSNNMVTMQEDHTLYAHWAVDTFTVTFNSNGGSAVSPSTKQVTYTQPYGELPVVTRAYATFDGWFTQPSGGTKVTATSLVTTPGSHMLYAHWKAVTMSASPATGIVLYYHEDPNLLAQYPTSATVKLLPVPYQADVEPLAISSYTLNFTSMKDVMFEKLSADEVRISLTGSQVLSGPWSVSLVFENGTSLVIYGEYLGIILPAQ